MTTERRDHMASILSIALESSSLDSHMTETERMETLNKMAYSLANARFVILHENDIDCIENVSAPTFIQHSAEKKMQLANSALLDGFEEWNESLDKVSEDSITRVKEIITKKY